jgi:hypothetical protein
MQGILFERLVLLAATEVDVPYATHVEYSSGLLLFKTVLYYFIFAEKNDDLINKVSLAIPPPSADDKWHLDNNIFLKWKENAAYVLSALFKLRQQNYHVTPEQFEYAFRTNINTIGLKYFQRDSLGRISFA